MRMPVVEVYRGVGIQDFQDEARIKVVKREIDVVYALPDQRDLISYARDVFNPPEARLFASDKIIADIELRAEAHQGGHHYVDANYLAAITAGLDSLGWADPHRYCSLLDTPPRPGAPGIEPRPAQQRDRLLAAQGAAGTRAQPKPTDGC
jgi:hypothetical protein